MIEKLKGQDFCPFNFPKFESGNKGELFRALPESRL
jgi:hypothetical protein